MNYFINLNRLQTFVSIVEAGNITKAASVLNVPKSKLSRDLTLLESELGVQLIFRTTRQFQLTQVGLNLYQECKKNLEQIHHLFSDIAFKKQKLSGLIRVTAPEDIGTSLIIEKISQFSSVYPQIKFDLLLTNHLLDLVSNRIDLAIRVGRLKDSTMISKHLGFIDLVLVSSTKYLNTINKLPRIEEFYQLRIVNFLSSSKKNVWTLSSDSKVIKIKIDPVLSVDHFLGVKKFLLQGQGVGLLPLFLCQQEIQNGDLIHIYKNWTGGREPIQILTPAQKEPSSLVKAFSDYLSNEIKKNFYN